VIPKDLAGASFDAQTTDISSPAESYWLLYFVGVTLTRSRFGLLLYCAAMLSFGMSPSRAAQICVEIGTNRQVDMSRCNAAPAQPTVQPQRPAAPPGPNPEQIRADERRRAWEAQQSGRSAIEDEQMTERRRSWLSQQTPNAVTSLPGDVRPVVQPLPKAGSPLGQESRIPANDPRVSGTGKKNLPEEAVQESPDQSHGCTLLQFSTVEGCRRR
jgi:hypothetical protein